MLERLPIEIIADERADPNCKVIVFDVLDGMAVVSKTYKENETRIVLGVCIRICAESEKKEGQGFDEARVIFDRYIEESFKSGTRTGETRAETVLYKMSDNTVIEHLTTKQVLSDIKTKQDLTKYLSMKLYDVFQDFAFTVSYEFTYISNICDINTRLKDHFHKKADTYIVLRSLHVTKRNSFTDLVVYYCVTDVRLMLLCYIDELCSSAIFCTTNRYIRHRTLNSHLALELCTSLLGFHVLCATKQVHLLDLLRKPAGN